MATQIRCAFCDASWGAGMGCPKNPYHGGHHYDSGEPLTPKQADHLRRALTAIAEHQPDCACIGRPCEHHPIASREDAARYYGRGAAPPPPGLGFPSRIGCDDDA